MIPEGKAGRGGRRRSPSSSRCSGLAGCNQAPAKMPPPKPPVVMIAEPVIREVTDYEEGLVGQTAAVQMVEVRARVNGYLEKVNFKDGDEVKEGAVLFEIDPRPYEAEVGADRGRRRPERGALKRLEADLKRARSLVARQAIGREEFDKIVGDYAEAGASVGIAKANRDLAKLNLEFAKVTAPISGRLSRRMVDPGNLVQADETILTSIVSLDPMYVYFDVDERTLLRIRRLIAEGKIKSRDAGRDPHLRGPGRRGRVPPQGDHRLQRQPGRPEHRDAPGPGRDRQPARRRVFSPGLFMRVRLPVGTPHKALLVAEQALGTDQGRKFLYVVKPGKDKDGKPVPNTAEYRPVSVGALHDGLQGHDRGPRARREGHRQRPPARPPGDRGRPQADDAAGPGLAPRAGRRRGGEARPRQGPDERIRPSRPVEPRPGYPPRSRSGDPRPVPGEPACVLAVLHRPADLRRGAVDRHHAGRRRRRLHAAARAVPADHAADGRQVDCNYPGASAQVVAETVAAPIEQQVNGVEDMMYMSSQCTNDGSYNLTVTFEHGIDLNMAQVLVQNRVSLAMPHAARRDQADRRHRHASGRPTSCMAHRHQLARRPLRPALPEQLRHAPASRTSWPGCRASATCIMFGQRDYSMRIWLDPDKLAAREHDGRRRGRAPSASRTRRSPPGRSASRRPPTARRSRSPLEHARPAERGRAVRGRSSSSATPDGRIVRLKDVARVELGAKNQDVDATARRPADSVGLAIFQLPDANALDDAPTASRPRWTS